MCKKKTAARLTQQQIHFREGRVNRLPRREGRGRERERGKRRFGAQKTRSETGRRVAAQTTSFMAGGARVGDACDSCDAADVYGVLWRKRKNLCFSLSLSLPPKRKRGEQKAHHERRMTLSRVIGRPGVNIWPPQRLVVRSDWPTRRCRGSDNAVV